MEIRRWLSIALLLLTTSAGAEVTGARMQFLPPMTEFPVPQWAFLDLVVDSTGLPTGIDYEYQIERKDGAQWLLAVQRPSGARYAPIRGLDLPGDYRITLLGNGSPIIKRKFRLVGKTDPEYGRVANTKLLLTRYALVVDSLERHLDAVRRKLAARLPVDKEFAGYQDAAAFATTWMGSLSGVGFVDPAADNPLEDVIDQVNYSTGVAPGGGPAIILGLPDDGDVTGAIVVTLDTPPAAVDNWNDLQLRVTLPAYGPVGLPARTTTVRFAPETRADSGVVSLKLHPGSTTFVENEAISFTTGASARYSLFRYQLERRVGEQYLPHAVSPSCAAAFCANGMPALPAGDYRLTSFVRESVAAPEVSASREFRVIAADSAAARRVAEQNRVRTRFEFVAFGARAFLARAKSRLFAADDALMDRPFPEIADESTLLESLGSRLCDCNLGTDWDLGDGGSAPGGGPAVIAGQPGDGDATGAIVLTVHAPTSATDWPGTRVLVTMPAWRGLKARTEEIRWVE